MEKCVSVSTDIKKKWKNHGTMDKRTMTIYPPKPTTLGDYMRTFCKSMFTKPNGQTISS